MSDYSAHLLYESLRVVLYVDGEDTLRGERATSLGSRAAPMIRDKL